MMMVVNNEKVPRLLYKYYSRENIEYTIRENTIKWEIPCNENDPFEALADRWDEGSVRREIGNSQEKEAILNTMFKSREVQLKISHITSYVSFSERGDNMLMWSHYGDKYAGACLEFHTFSLEKYIDKVEHVEYAKEVGERRDPIPLPREGQDDTSPEYQNRVRKFLAHKAKEWEYEEEWRLMVPPMANIIKYTKVDDKWLLVSAIPKGVITRLIFGCNMPIPMRVALAKQIKINHRNCQFAEIVPDRQYYKLTLEPLEFDMIENPQNQTSN